MLALGREAGDVQSLQSEFEALLEAVEEATPRQVTKAVFRHLVADHFGKAAPINWYGSDAEEFKTAIQYSILDEQDHAVDWSRGKMKKLRAAITAVVQFVESEEGQTLAASSPDENWDPDDLEFWDDRA